MMIGDAMTPFYPVLPRFTPRFTVDVTVFEVKFDVDVNFFRFNLPLPKSCLKKTNLFLNYVKLDHND